MRPVLLLATCVGLACSVASNGRAASVEISPVYLGFAAGQNSGLIELKNAGDDTAALQIRAFAWRQAGDDDVLTPTEEVIVSPPIFTMMKGGSQTARILLRGGGTTGGKTYRLILDEVPPAGPRNRQIMMRLRISLPLVTEPPNGGREALKWRAGSDAQGRTTITATNAGTAVAKINHLEVTLPDGQRPKIAARGQTPYVLPGAERHWILQGVGVAPGTRLRVSVATGAGTTEQTLMP